jgi:hypothetical protein
LNALLPPDHLQDVFSRIFAHLDQQVPALFVAAASTAAFSFPSTDAGKYRLLLEVGYTTKVLNGLAGVLPWDFTAINVLERKMDYKFPELAVKNETSTEEPDPKVQAGKEKPSNEAADPTVQVGKEEPSNEVADPTVQAGKEEPSNEVAAPTIQAEKEEPSNEVADPKDEDVVVNVNEANSLDYVQERDTSSDNALNGNKEPLKSNGCENAESDVDTQATAVVNLKSPSSSSENDKSIPEKNNGNESLVNNAEP